MSTEAERLVKVETEVRMLREDFKEHEKLDIERFSGIDKKMDKLIESQIALRMQVSRMIGLALGAMLAIQLMFKFIG